MHPFSLVVNLALKGIEPLRIPKNEVNSLFKLLWVAKVLKFSQLR